MENGNKPAADSGLEGAPSSSFDIEQIWYVAREKAWLILLCGLLGIMAGLAYIYRTPLTYCAQSVIQVDTASTTTVPGYQEMQPATNDLLGEDMLQTFMASFRSREFAERVIVKNHLLDNPNFIPLAANGQPHLIGDAEGALLGMMNITPLPATRFLAIRVTHSDPVMAKELANMVANECVSQSNDDRAAADKVDLDYLKKQADDAMAKLDEDQQAVDKYVKNYPSVDDIHDTTVTDWRAKRGELQTATTNLATLTADDELAQKSRDNPDALLKIASVANDPTILGLNHLISQDNAAIEVLKLTYTVHHPKMIEAMAERTNHLSELNQAVLAVPDAIHAKRVEVEAQVARLKDEFGKLDALALALDDKKSVYEDLKQIVDEDQATYGGMLTKLRELPVASGLADNRGVMHVFENAQVPVEPVQARKSKTLMMSLMGGLVLGLGLSFGLHMMDSSVKSVDQSEDLLGLTVLAAIPRQTPNRLKESGLALVRAPGSPVAEAFRSLRTSIYLAGKSKGRKIILFTSSLASEGKTFCSVNYATSLAQQGLTTLVIDADLRSPAIRGVLLGDRNVPGLGELLSKKVTPAQAIHECEIENLWVMPAGGLLQNPAEVLASTNFGEIIHQLSEKFERIVIDTAPVTAVSDTLLLLEHAQAICLVTQAARTPRKWVLRALKLIAKTGSRPIGTILNQMPAGMAGIYSYYPGRYGDPEVYGNSNGSYGAGGSRGRKGGEEPEPELETTEPRF